MEDFKNVKKFIDYLIIDDDGWKGIRDDAPTTAKKAYEKYMKEQKRLEDKGIKTFL